MVKVKQEIIPPKSTEIKVEKGIKKRWRNVGKAKLEKEAEKILSSNKIKKNVSEIKIDKMIENINFEKLKIDQNQLKEGIEALLKYNEKRKSSNLFKDQQQVFVQITCIKIPKIFDIKYRIELKHPFITNESEICLIVPDLERGRKVDHEATIEHYEELLRSKNITCIKRILPIRQIRVEYDQFELKRRLCNYYDRFIVDGRISGHVIHLLGKIFEEKRKLPIPICMNDKKLKTAISKALNKTELNVHSHGDSYSVQIGHTAMSVEQLTENLLILINGLTNFFPGRWDNIRALHVKTENSIAIPVYYTLKSGNDVKVPVFKPKKPNQTITDEISTRDFPVTVHPDGRIEEHRERPLPKKNKKTKLSKPFKNKKKNLKKKVTNGQIKKETIKTE